MSYLSILLQYKDGYNQNLQQQTNTTLIVVLLLWDIVSNMVTDWLYRLDLQHNMVWSTQKDDRLTIIFNIDGGMVETLTIEV